MTTLSGSHVIAGAAAAMSSLGSAVAIAMMVGGGGIMAIAIMAIESRSPLFLPVLSFAKKSSYLNSTLFLPY